MNGEKIMNKEKEELLKSSEIATQPIKNALSNKKYNFNI